VTYQTSATIAMNVLSTWTYQNLVFNAANSTYSFTGNISIGQSLTLSTGVVQTALNVSGNVTVTNALLVDSGTFIVRASSTPADNVHGGAGQTITVGSLLINPLGSMNADNQGFPATQGPGYQSAAGATHGGVGYLNTLATYGSFTNPTT